MGELIGGEWHVNGIETVTASGRLERPPSVFRDWVTVEGCAPPGGRAFKAERDRYHLYVSLACPWAHRALILRSLKGLEKLIGLSVVHWLMGEEGWTFEPGPGVVPDMVNGQHTLHGLYTRADPACTSRVTVPVLWDKETRRVVSNSDDDILRMLNSEFADFATNPFDYYPPALRAEIDALIEQHSQNWRLERMPVVDRNLLRCGIAELLGFPKTPAAIVINESLEVARRYAAPESIHFLNGVLDAVARDLLKARLGIG